MTPQPQDVTFTVVVVHVTAGSQCERGPLTLLAEAAVLLALAVAGGVVLPYLVQAFVADHGQPGGRRPRRGRGGPEGQVERIQ